MPMMLVWVAAIVGLPAGCFALGPRRTGARRFRVVSLFAGTLMLGLSALPLVTPRMQHWRFTWAWLGEGAPAILRLDALSAVLPALAAALWLFTVAVTPKMLLDTAGLRRTALATAFTTLGFVTEHPLMLLAAWTASVLTLRAGMRTRGKPGRGFTNLYLAASVGLFAGGVAVLLISKGLDERLQVAGLILLVMAALIRKGIFPFHAWIPSLFENGRLGPAILFSAPQLGTYAVAVLVVPRAPQELLRLLALLSLATAVYTAALALVQRSARRACAYLFLSQSSLVMAGLDCTSGEALTGALVLWLSSSLAFAGLARCVLVLEARRGRLDLSCYSGNYERTPFLAATFLLFGLSLAGFPGTMGFVGEELLLGGAVADFPVLGYLVVASGAFTGLAVLRMYFSLFCGKREDGVSMERRLREGFGFGLLAGALLLFGLAPAPLVQSRLAASESILEHREEATSDFLWLKQKRPLLFQNLTRLARVYLMIVV